MLITVIVLSTSETMLYKEPGPSAVGSWKLADNINLVLRQNHQISNVSWVVIVRVFEWSPVLAIALVQLSSYAQVW